MSKRTKKNRKSANHAEAVEETRGASPPEVVETPEDQNSAEISGSDPGQIENVWRFGIWAILGAAFLLRFFWLTLKPFHHDEGVNGFFLTGLFRDGVYKY